MTDSQYKDLGKDYLEHYGVLGMRWGVRKDSISSLTKKANRYAWKSEKYARKATKKLVKKISKDQSKGKTETRANPDLWVKSIKYKKKAQTLLDRIYPELSKVSWKDLEKQSNYKDVMYWKTPKWA